MDWTNLPRQSAAQVRGLAFATLVFGVVALILIDRSNSNSVLSALLRPNKALAVVLPVVAVLLALTFFWAPARDLFSFGVLEGVWLAVPPLAEIGVLLMLEALKPLWRMVLRRKPVNMRGSHEQSFRGRVDLDQ
jgi:Ca2+-transporting ATPase